MTAVVHHNWADRFDNLDGLIDEIIRDPGRIRRNGQGQGVSAMREIGGELFFAKIYLPGRISRRLRDLIGRMRALREWRRNIAAADAGIEVATLVLAMSERRWWSCRHLVVTAPVKGTSVSDILDGDAPCPMDLGELLQLIGRELARFHQLGFFHLHITSTHLFLNEKGRLTCIDLEGSRILKPVPANLRMKNLRQIRESLDRYPISRGRFPELEAAYKEAWESPSEVPQRA